MRITLTTLDALSPAKVRIDTDEGPVYEFTGDPTSLLEPAPVTELPYLPPNSIMANRLVRSRFQYTLTVTGIVDPVRYADARWGPAHDYEGVCVHCGSDLDAVPHRRLTGAEKPEDYPHHQHTD